MLLDGGMAAAGNRRAVPARKPARGHVDAPCACRSPRFPLAGHLDAFSRAEIAREDKRERLDFLVRRSLEIAADPSIGLALIHLPVPHPPTFYTQPGTHREEPPGYRQGLVLADRILGELRRALEGSGLAPRTALLVSSDHGWRTAHWRGGPEWTHGDEAFWRHDTAGVPFLLQLPGQTAEVVCTDPFNTVVTRRILTAILEGRLTDPRAIAGLIAEPRLGTGPGGAISN